MIAELVADDGSMMRYPQVAAMGSRMGLPVLTIEELVNYRRIHDADRWSVAPRVRRAAETVLPTPTGELRAIGYRDTETGAEHIALVSTGMSGNGLDQRAPLVRVHSECLTGEAFSSQRCECGPQLDAAIERISYDGGVVVYLHGHEGRGIGLLKKLAAYRLQDQGLDIVEANLELDEPVDGREYGTAAAILADLGIDQARVMTNNPDKVRGLTDCGIEITQRVPLIVGVMPANVRYLDAKRQRLGHLLGTTSGSGFDLTQTGDFSVGSRELTALDLAGHRRCGRQTHAVRSEEVEGVLERDSVLVAGHPGDDEKRTSNADLEPGRLAAAGGSDLDGLRGLDGDESVARTQ